MKRWSPSRADELRRRWTGVKRSAKRTRREQRARARHLRKTRHGGVRSPAARASPLFQPSDYERRDRCVPAASGGCPLRSSRWRWIRLELASSGAVPLCRASWGSLVKPADRADLGKQLRGRDRAAAMKGQLSARSFSAAVSCTISRSTSSGSSSSCLNRMQLFPQLSFPSSCRWSASRAPIT